MTPQIQTIQFDLPALHRHFVGFDNIFEEINRTFHQTKQDNYPPHNIIRTAENRFTIELAVAGFDQSELDVEVASNEYNQQVLTISGKRNRDEDQTREYLHRGLAARNFERSFTLQNHVEITNVAVENGIMSVNLEQRIPESLKPKKVAITFKK
jgi:molecular chaperone IbpA